MKKVFLTGFFFTLTPFVLLASLIYLSFFSFQKNGSTLFGHKTSSVAFAALPSADIFLEGQLLLQDIRVENLKNFFSENKSPLLPFAENLVSASEKYDIDYRLVPAIAMQESNLCKKAPKDSYNCWGFGMYGRKTVKFDNFGEAIDSVSKTLAEDYKSIGLITPEQIMTKYAPSNNGAWADSVNFFMNKLQLP